MVSIIFPVINFRNVECLCYQLHLNSSLHKPDVFVIICNKEQNGISQLLKTADETSNSHTPRLNRLLAQRLEPLGIMVLAVEGVLVHALLPRLIVIKIQPLVPVLPRVQVVGHGVDDGIQRLAPADALQQRRVEGPQGHLVDGAGEVDDADALLGDLVLRRLDDAVHGGLEEAARQQLERLADVDDQRVRQVLHPLPRPVVVEDLQCRNGLREEEREGAPVRVARQVEVAVPLVVFVRAGVVDHLGMRTSASMQIAEDKQGSST